MKFGKTAAGALALALLLASCSPAGGAAPSPTPVPTPVSTPAAASDEAAFAELMAEVEARNRGIDAPNGGLDRFKYDFAGGGPLLTEAEWGLEGPERPPETLSQGDARAEADYLFRLLRTHYGLYTWFGGDVAFGAAEDEVLASLEGREELTLEEYQALLWESLDFINDGHFVLGGRQFVTRRALLCNEDLLFARRDGAFYLGERRLDAVDGGDPAESLKRAVGPEGELTWKLYVSSPDGLSRDVALTFADGTETVEAAPVRDTQRTIGLGGSPFRMEEQEGALFVRMDRMTFVPEDGVSEALIQAGDGTSQSDFIASAGAALEYPAVVVDLTQNPGGNGGVPERWFEGFTGVRPEPNYGTLGLDPFGWGPRSGEEAEGVYRVRRPAPQFLEREEGPFLIVLTSRGTASAAENFTDLSHNLGRALVIGSNTGGCLTGSQTWFDMRLPWSGLAMAWGEDLFYWPEAYFQEGVGLEPDVYLTGVNQSRRLSRFLERYVL